MTTPAPPPPGGGNGIEVNKDNVLAARKVILHSADDAEDKLRHLRGTLAITNSPEDQVSVAAATEWNKNLVTDADSHFNKLNQYVRNVRDLAKQLEEAAKQYGYTDEEIATSLQAQNKRI